MTVLSVRGLEVAYGGVTAVRGLTLEVAQGEIVGLIGPNGAGKSTTLHAIMGLVPARGGDVLLGERSLRGRTPEAIARSGVALVPEGRRLFAELTVDENLRLGLAARSGSAGVEEDLVEIYDLFPVCAEFRDRHAGALSGGQQQQLAIARAMISSPSFLLLDEPSLGLAPIVSKQIFESMDALKRAGIAIIVVEQNARMGLRFADWGCVLDLGKLEFEGPSGTVLNDPRIEELYLGRQGKRTGTDG